MKTKFVAVLSVAALACLSIFALHRHGERSDARLTAAKAVSPPPFVSSPEVPPAEKPEPRAARPRPADDAIIDMPELPPSQGVLWEKPSGPASMTAFQKWTAGYSSLPPEGKGPAVAEGVRLAKERRAAMHTLIKRDPEQALANAVPERVRRNLPKEVVELLEEKVDARGDLIVTGASAPDGRVPEGRSAVRSQALLDDGRKLEAFVYGNREFKPSRAALPIHGIALDGAMAVSQWPGRVLEPIERAEARQALGAEPLCPASGVPVAETGTEEALLTGKSVQFYCGPAHARNELHHAAAEEAILPPGLDVRLHQPVDAASGGAGQTVPSPLAEGDSSWTTGTKRILAVRVEFLYFDDYYSNYTGLDVADCEQIVADIRSAYNDWSYGRLNVLPVQSGGSKVSPVVRLNRPAANYDGGDIGDIWDEVQDKVDDMGIDPDNYDYILVFGGDAPVTDEEDDSKIVWWSGLGRIGEGLSFIRVNNPTWNNQERIDRNVRVSLHEIGHNMGLYHSSNLWTSLQIVDGSLVGFEEYGDRYDKMGHGGADFNVRNKQWLNWLDDGNVPYGFTDGVYKIREHDLEEKSGVRGLQFSVEPVFIPLNSFKQIFVEYRLDGVDPLTGYPYIPYNETLRAYGAQIRLGKVDAPKTWLLDATPETPNWEPVDPNTDEPDTSGNVDAPLLPGRTISFSRSGNAIYITNLSADPDAGELQVEVQHGPVAGNDPPSGSIATNTPQGASNQNIIFTANVSDPEDSDLAYHWQIPYFNYNSTHPAVFPNSRSIIVKFPATGNKTVRCIVSDKHGGTVTLTRNFSVITNSPPSISAIANQNFDEDESILNMPFTVSDTTTPAGSLSVTVSSSNTNLFPGGSITLGGSGGNRNIDLVPPANRHGTAIITLNVSDGVLTDSGQFEVTVNAVTPGTTLIASGALWRYWDESAAPSGNWKIPVYDETGWGNDNTRFVYPAPFFNILGWTVLGSPLPARTTCYFRKTFFMTASPVGAPTLRLLCDDGAIVYANGIEIYRQNMPDGTVKSTTRAESSVEGVKETAWTLVPLNLASFHLGGSNTFAVEVHDAGGTRGAGDVTFDFELALLQAPAVSNITDKFSPEDQVAGAYSFTASDSESPGGPLTYRATSSNQALVLDSSINVGFNFLTLSRYLMITPQPNANGVTEITLMVSDGSSETWEKFNLTITPVNDPPYVVPLPDMAVAFGEIAPLVEVQIGDVDGAAGSVTATATSSNQSFLPNAGIQVLPGTSPDRRWLRITPTPGVAAQATVTVTASDGSGSSNDAFVFRVSLPQNITGSDIRLMKSGDTWRYWEAALPLDTHGQPIDFTDPKLDDRAWLSGPSRLGYGNDGEATGVRVTPYRVTTYFRKKFTVPNRATVSQLKLRMLRDDGAVVYLNGDQVWASNMPRVTSYTPATLAASDVAGAEEDEWQSTTVSAASLVSGSNTIAVELHQRVMPTSLVPGDLSFDFELDGVPATPNAPDVIVAPGEMWAYWDQTSYPDDTWRLATFAEDGWKYGLARLGYGIGGESTIVNDDSANGTQRNPSVLFRKVFDIADPSVYTSLHLFTQRDDGIAVHLNGIRVHLENIASSASLGDLATAEAPAGEQILWRHYLIDSKRLLAGRNLLAVEIHQNSLSGTDLNFDLQLTGDLTGIPPLYIRPSGNAFELSWPASYNGWFLRGTTDLTNWSPVADPPLLDAGWIYVISPGPGPHRFFKLEKP